MTERIRVGLVGPRGNWGSRAHIPSIRSLPAYELAAVCTTSMATAREAAEAHCVELAFDDVSAMAAHPGVDLVVVSVRVPYHHEIVMAAIEAGKDVFCEWPLAANLRQAEEMALAAKEAGVQTFVGLQARSDPALIHMRNLIEDGWIGDIVAVNLVAINGGVLERPAERMWSADVKAGANTMTIHAGHNLDALRFIAGEFEAVSATVATQVKRWRATGTDDMTDVTSPDNIIVNGTLLGGAVASFHAASVPFHAGGLRLEVFGREGKLVINGANTLNLGPNLLLGSRGAATFEELTPPSSLSLTQAGAGNPMTANLCQSYARIAAARSGEELSTPDFTTGLTLTHLLDAVQRSSDEGRRISLSGG